jgi:hypothetical protein
LRRSISVWRSRRVSKASRWKPRDSLVELNGIEPSTS